MHKITVSVVEATGLLSIGKTTLFALMREGQLQRIKVGRNAMHLAWYMLQGFWPKKLISFQNRIAAWRSRETHMRAIWHQGTNGQMWRES